MLAPAARRASTYYLLALASTLIIFGFGVSAIAYLKREAHPLPAAGASRASAHSSTRPRPLATTDLAGHYLQVNRKFAKCSVTSRRN
jgi:hypothetical protein